MLALVPPLPGAAEVESGGDVGGELVHFDGPLAFTADDLLCAIAEIMGESTYGTVYKAAAARPLRHRLLLARPRGCGWPAWPQHHATSAREANVERYRPK